MILLCALGLAGCATLDGGPYREAYIRFARTGAAVRPHFKPAEDDSVQAVYDSFDRQVAEGLAARDGE